MKKQSNNNKRVLIVEDDPATGNLLKTILMRFDYEVQAIVNTGEDAIEKVHYDQPDIILMDIALKGSLDGIETARNINKLDRIPIIFLTTLADENIIEKAMTSNAYGLLLKPIDGNELKIALEMSFNTSRIEALQNDAEKKLQQSEKQYRELVQSINSIVMTFNQDARVTFINNYAQDFFGFKEDEILGKSIFGTILAKYDSQGIDLEEMAQSVFKNPEKYTINENENICKDGSKVWVSWSNKAVYDEKGTLLEILSTGHDITDRIKLKHDLIKSENRFRGLVESSEDWIWEVDANGVYTYASPRAEEILGYSPDEIINKTPFDFMPEDEGKRVSKIFNEITESRSKIINLLNANKHKDGRIIYLETNASPMFNEDNDLIGYRGIDRDITVRRKQDDELRTLWQGVEQSSISIIITDVEGVIEYINPFFCEMSGYTPDEVIGQKPRLLKSDYHIDSYYESLWKEISSGRTWNDEMCNKKKNGEIHWEQVTISPVFSEENKITHYIAFKEDISQLKEAELIKDDVEKILRHDLKNPLNAIIGFPQLLIKSGGLNDKQLSFCRHIEDSGKRMLSMINNYFDMIKIERGIYDVKYNIINIFNVIESVFHDIEQIASRKNVEMKYSSENKENEILVKGEHFLLYNSFLNLIKNAVEASPKQQSVNIKVFKKDNEVLVEINNFGSVPKNMRQCFFDKYATSGKLHGTGLGTYSAKIMLNAMGASVDLNIPSEDKTSISIKFPSFADLK